MSWRVVVIAKRAKLEYKMNYLVVRDTELLRIHLSEVHTLMIESTAVSLTAMLIAQLQERKINVIFCDNSRNPLCNVLPFYGCHDSTKKIKTQLAWKLKTKDVVWVRLVQEKIRNQANLLVSISPERANILFEYANQVEEKDATNREAHAARVYFNTLFGSAFSRQHESLTNAALNYGYTILLSAINREIATNGYLTQLGIFHDNMFNEFNLSSDFIEPIRPLIDKEVLSWGEIKEFTSLEKMKLVDVLNGKVTINGKQHHFLQGLEIFCRSIFDALTKDDPDVIQWIEYG